MAQLETINTPQDYVNYTFNVEARGIAEVSGELMGLSNTVNSLLGLIAFKTSEFLTHTETMAIGAGVAISAMFTSATQDAIRFQQQVANVKAIGGESVDAQKIGDAAMEYSNKFGMATASMTEGLEALARAGITTTSVMKGVLEEGVKLSKLEGIDLEDSINDLISTTNLLSTDDVDMNAPEYAEMLKTMNQHIVSTSESAPINAQNIIQSLQHVGGYASASGMDQDDLFAVIAQLGARGTKGEMAGTALRAFIAAGQKDTAQRALARIGLNVTDLWNDNGETMLSISEMKDVLDDALESRGYSKQEKLEFYSDFAGYKQANQIMKIDTSEVAKYKETIADAWDLGTKLDTILGTVRGNLDRIWQIAQNFMTKVGGKLLTLMGAILTPVRVALELFTKIPFADTAVAAGMLFIGFRTGLMIFNKLVPALGGFMSGLKNVKKESFSFNQIWKDTKKEMTLTKEIFDNITDQQSLTKIHLRERGLSATDKSDVETQIAAQMYMGSDEYEKTGLEWKELPNAVQNALVAQFKTTDNFDKNYKLYLEKTNEFVNNATKDPIEIKEFKKKDQLTSINNYVKYIFELFKGKFEKDDRSKQGKGGKGGGSNSGSSPGDGGSDSPIIIKSPSERIEDYKKIGQRIQSQASEYGDYLWKSSIPELKNPVESFDIQSLIDTRDKIIADINKKMDNYSTFSPDGLNNIGVERLKKSLTRDAMTDFGIAFSTYSNTSDIRQILSTGQYRKGTSKISGAQINAIAEELGIDIKAPKNLDEKSRENLMLTLSNYYKSKYGDDQSVLNNISNKTQKIWHDEQVNKENVSFFPTNTLMKYSDTTDQIQSLLGVQSIKGIQDYFKNNKNDSDYEDNLDKTIKIMSENSDLIDDLVNAEIKYMYENLVRVQNSIKKIQKQSNTTDIPQGDNIWGHRMHDTERGMLYDAATYIKKTQNKRVIEPKVLFDLIKSVNGEDAAKDAESFLNINRYRDKFTKENGKIKITPLIDAMAKGNTQLWTTHKDLKRHGLEQVTTPRQVLNLTQKHPEIADELTKKLNPYVDVRMGEKPTQQYFEDKGWIDQSFIPIPYEYTWLLGADTANGLVDHLSGSGPYRYGHKPTVTFDNALKLWEKLGPESILNDNFSYLYDDDLMPTVDNSFERMMLGLVYGTLDNKSAPYGSRSLNGGISLYSNNTQDSGAAQTLNTLIHEFTHMALQQDYRHSLDESDALFLPKFTDREVTKYGYAANYPWLADEFETNWVSSQVFQSIGLDQLSLVQDRTKGFYDLTDKNGYVNNLQWELYDEWIKVISENIDKFIDIGEAFDKKYSSLNPKEISQKWDTLRTQINNTQSTVSDESYHKRQEEIANLRKQISEQEALWATQGEKYAQERVKQQKELREKQQKAYQEERKKLQEQQKQQAELYKESRKNEKKRLQEKWDKNISNKPKTKLWFDTAKEEKKYQKQIEKSKPLFNRMRDKIKSNTGSDKWYFAGEERWKDNNKQTAFQKKMQKWGLYGVDKAEEYTNKGKENLVNAVNTINEKSWQHAREQTGEGVDWGIEQVENVSEKMTDFRNVLSGLSEIFPQLTPAVMALDYALTLQEYVTKGLKFASDILTVARGEESMATTFETAAEEGNIAAKFMMTAANWAESESTWQRVAGTLALTAADMFASAAEAVLTFLRSIGAAGILAIAAAILIVVAAIEAVKFWENKHAEALKESQKALQESTAKNNVALSQYKDMKKAREAETDSIKKQQKARKEAIALYKLEAARIEKQKAVYEEAKVRNDSVWGEYGLRASMQKMGLGFIAGGDFESQYENYDGTTKNVRQIKEATLGNLFATSEQQQVASFYDNNQMFLASVEAYKDPLTELYDKESKLIEQYGSIDAARGTKEFEEAVQEFADATGLNGETAVKMLDWLETENKVDQATAVGEARIGMIMAQRNAKLMQIEYGDEYEGTDFNDVGNAMVMAQFQDMMNTAKTEVWWDLLFAYLDLIATLVNPLAWGDVGKKMAAIGVHQEALSQLGKEGNSILSDMYDAYENSERKDYGTGAYTIMDADTPFGAAKEASAMNYADTQQQMFFSETGQTYTEDEYLAIQDQYQEDTFGTSGQQDRDKAFATGEKNREEAKKKQNEKKETTLGQLQENGETAHQDALDIIDAIKNPGILSGLGAGIYNLFGGDTINSLIEGGFRGLYDYGKGLASQGVERLRGIAPNAMARAETALSRGNIKAIGSNILSKGKGVLTEGITNFKNTEIGGKLADRVALARETNMWAEGGASISRSGFDKAVGLADSAKAAYAEDGLKGLANFGKNTAKSGATSITNSAKGAPSAIKGAISEAGGLKGIHASAMGEMKSAFNPKALAGGVDDIAKGLKGGGSLMKGIGRVGGTALMALGPALAFADKASELNPFDGPHYNEDGTEKKALQATGEVVGTTVGALGGVAGGLEGAAAGAALGTAILPGIGTVIGGIAGGIAGGWLGDTIFQPIGDAIGGTIGWLGDNLLGGIQDVAGNVWDGLTGAAGGVWDAVSGAATGAWEFLTGGEDDNRPVGGLLGWTPIGMGINAAAGIGEWLFGGNEGNDPYKNVEKATGQKIPKGEGQSKNTIIIKNININTEDDPEKIKSAFMNLMIELQEQVNPRQVSRTVGEPPQAATNTNEGNEGENGNQNQAEGSDNDSTNPTI